MFAAAGDNGAFDDYEVDHSRAHVVDDPGSQSYVTCVGGSKLTVNAKTGTYKSEVVWNDGPFGASGGGISQVWPMPNYQAKVDTTDSKTHRNTPDVSLNADPNTGYANFFDGQWTAVGGTSCAAPSWAAFIVRVNQAREEKGMKPVGFLNPVVYAIGKGASYKVNFHGITKGNNLVYKAKVGYDNASGWGSFNGAKLLRTLANEKDIVKN